MLRNQLSLLSDWSINQRELKGLLILSLFLYLVDSFAVADEKHQ